MFEVSLGPRDPGLYHAWRCLGSVWVRRGETVRTSQALMRAREFLLHGQPCDGYACLVHADLALELAGLCWAQGDRAGTCEEARAAQPVYDGAQGLWERRAGRVRQWLRTHTCSR